MSSVDTRRVIGSSVHAKAVHVTNKAECSRRYGSRMKLKMLPGTVVEVHNSVTKQNGRTSTFLTCDFILCGDVTKRSTLNIRSVKAGPPPGQAAASPANPASGSTLVSKRPAVRTTAVTGSENPMAGSGENPTAASQNLAAVTANWTDIRAGGSRTDTETASEDDVAVTAINRDLARAEDSAEFVQTLMDNLRREEASQNSELEANQNSESEAAAMANASTAAETTTGTATGGIATAANELRSRNRHNHRGAATVPVTATAQATVPATATAQATVQATVPTTATAQAPILPVVVAHGVEWYSDHRGNTKLPIQGVVPPRSWAARTSVGEMVGPGSDIGKHRSRLDYFLLMFPPLQLNEIVRLTNIHLTKKRRRLTTVGETIKFLGVLILTTRFEFGRRSSLWSTSQFSKYRGAPCFGKTGMSRVRFDDLWASIAFSEQPATRPESMTSEQYRWLLVDGFVEKFNDYRKDYFIPSHTICVDESISRWYGQGGFWINIGLPMYMAIDRKPENGCEIQNAACGNSGVMLRLKLVKTAEEEGANALEDDDGLLHGTVVLKNLVLPWANTNRIVCGDSYFASVGACEEMQRIGLRFIGVVKTATRQFPMAYLSSLELVQRGDRHGLTTPGPDGTPKMLAFVWMDRNRRYFIANTSSLLEGAPYSRIRWRQVDTTINADAERVELTIPQPLACETYYDTCAQIDRHNRMRQDDLMLERKLGTMDWSLRVNLSLFGMCVVDAWLMYSKCTETEEKQREFYELLAEEMIDNTHDLRGRRHAPNSVTGSPELITPDGHMRTGIGAHLTPTKRKRKTKDGKDTSYMQQGRCNVCGMKTTMVCSECQDENMSNKSAPETWICKPTTSCTCFANHMADSHGL
jgi:hypothetical protein